MGGGGGAIEKLAADGAGLASPLSAPEVASGLALSSADIKPSPILSFHRPLILAENLISVKLLI
jgi:hypothetical protein